MLLIYSLTITPRLVYIVQTLMSALGIEYRLTTDTADFSNHTQEKIAYAAERTDEKAFHIVPAEILFQNDVVEQNIACFKLYGLKAFFKTPSGDFPFDIFSASFYLISRYEEYLPHKFDSYGRYAHENSIAFKENFLHLPVVNLWLQEFKKQLQQKFPQLKFNPQLFKFIPTYDIDIAYSYLSKGIVRNAAGALRSMVKGEWLLVKQRLSVLQEKQKDPFDIYQWLDELHQQYALKPIYFFLLAEKQKGYDKNIHPSDERLQKLIADHSKKYEVGIHPSWQSGDDVSLLKSEIHQLKSITGHSVKCSRQHYIRMQLPDTYQQLISSDIEKDYSMGYGSINGFRASYCLPFKWYDLKKDEATNLTIYPFCFMEANSYYEQHYTLQQAAEELQHYYKITKQVDGLLITIMHNHLLGDKKLFEGWKEMYRIMIKMILKD